MENITKSENRTNNTGTGLNSVRFLIDTGVITWGKWGWKFHSKSESLQLSLDQLCHLNIHLRHETTLINSERYSVDEFNKRACIRFR